MKRVWVEKEDINRSLKTKIVCDRRNALTKGSVLECVKYVLT